MNETSCEELRARLRANGSEPTSGGIVSPLSESAHSRRAAQVARAAKHVEPRKAKRVGARERLEDVGVRSLSDTELLALLLRAGTRKHDVESIAKLVLSRFGSLSQLAEQSPHAVAALPGLGAAKAASLIAACELGRRCAAQPFELGARIESPAAVQRHFATLLPSWRRESFHVLHLDGRNRLIDIELVSLGTLTASLVHPREVFRAAIQQAAAAVILVHNHPSGDSRPSGEDRRVTARLRAAGEMLGIRVLDHVIVAEGGYYSFSEAEPELGLGTSKSLSQDS